jgi:predicted acyl esterase
VKDSWKIGRLRRVSALIALTAAASFLAQASRQAATDPPLSLTKDVAVPMRDATILRADVLLPSSAGRFPVLIYRTPYGKQFALKEYKTFEKAVARGYAVVIQDVRGRYASDGDFNPYQNEGRDGYDTIEWAARQPWSDGNVGTFGLS